MSDEGPAPWGGRRSAAVSVSGPHPAGRPPGFLLRRRRSTRAKVDPFAPSPPTPIGPSADGWERTARARSALPPSAPNTCSLVNAGRLVARSRGRRRRLLGPALSPIPGPRRRHAPARDPLEPPPSGASRDHVLVALIVTKCNPHVGFLPRRVGPDLRVGTEGLALNPSGSASASAGEHVFATDSSSCLRPESREKANNCLPFAPRARIISE